MNSGPTSASTSPPKGGSQKAPPGWKDPEILCPHCWHKFPASMVMAISKHAPFGRDPVAGEDFQYNLRFRPSRFSEGGVPLDPMGDLCETFACPECHLGLSRANLTARPLFVSLVGAPRAGKTFLLTSAVRNLRAELRAMGRDLLDASPHENQIIERHISKLFGGIDSMGVAPSDMLPPTHSDRPANGVIVRVRGQEKRLLKPFQYHYTARASTKELKGDGVGTGSDRIVAVYDNPGQDYLSGSGAGVDAVQHIMHSKVILFVLNPVGDRHLLGECDAAHPMVQAALAERSESPMPQRLVLSEAVKRLADRKGKTGGGQLGVRVVVVVSKADVVTELYPLIRDVSPYREDPGGVRQLNQEVVDSVSNKAREFLEHAWGDVLAVADRADSRSKAMVLPVSVFDPEIAKRVSAGTGEFRVTREAVRPWWVEVPLQWALEEGKP